MKVRYFLTLLTIFGIFLFGCTQITTKDVMEKKDTTMKKDDAMVDKVITSGDNVESGSLVHDVQKDEATVSYTHLTLPTTPYV